MLGSALEAIKLYVMAFADSLFVASFYSLLVFGRLVVLIGLVIWLYQWWFLPHPAPHESSGRASRFFSTFWRLFRPLLLANIAALAAGGLFRAYSSGTIGESTSLVKLVTVAAYGLGLLVESWQPHSRKKLREESAEAQVEAVTPSGHWLAQLGVGLVLGLALWIICWGAHIGATWILARLLAVDYHLMLSMVSDNRGPWALAGIVRTSGQLWPALLLLAVIIAPSQELYYRVLVLKGAKGFRPTWLVALVAGLFFGLMSTSGIHIVAASLAGFVLSYAWLRRGAYLELVAAHWAWAACALIAWNYLRIWPV